jgi:hypothetical protein
VLENLKKPKKIRGGRKKKKRGRKKSKLLIIMHGIFKKKRGLRISNLGIKFLKNENPFW